MSDAESLVAVPGPMTARQVCRALYGHFTPRYAVLTEFTTRVRTNPDTDRWPRYADRRVDVLLVNRTERIAVEVKISRADYLNDIRRPEKQAPWRAITHRFAYAAPAGLIKADELPPDTGLIEVFPGQYGQVTWRRQVKRRPECDDLPARITWAAAIRLAAAEARLKGHTYDGADVDDIESVRAQLRLMQADLQREISRRMTSDMRAASYKRLYARHEPPPCLYCRTPIKPTPVTSRRGDGWRHVDTSADAPCLEARQRAALASSTLYRIPDITPADDPEDTP